jgi:hypothetical protein
MPEYFGRNHPSEEAAIDWIEEILSEEYPEKSYEEIQKEARKYKIWKNE